MSDGSVDALLRDLAAELEIEPSAELTSRVRTRVEGFSRRATLVRNWQLGVAFTVLAGALGLTVDPGWPRVSQSSVNPAPLEAVLREPATVARDGAITADPAVAAVPVRRIPVGRRPVHAALASLRTMAATAPELIVPPDQAIALRSILAAMRVGQSPVPPDVAVTLDAAGRLPAPAQIDIPEITIERLWPSANGGGSRPR